MFVLFAVYNLNPVHKHLYRTIGVVVNRDISLICKLVKKKVSRVQHFVRTVGACNRLAVRKLSGSHNRVFLDNGLVVVYYLVDNIVCFINRSLQRLKVCFLKGFKVGFVGMKQVCDIVRLISYDTCIFLAVGLFCVGGKRLLELVEACCKSLAVDIVQYGFYLFQHVYIGAVFSNVAGRLTVALINIWIPYLVNAEASCSLSRKGHTGGG